MIHQTLGEGRWFSMTFAQQMANVGSEFSRMCRAFENKNESRFNNALDRFLELLFLTLEDPKRTFSQRRELCRLKENALCYFFDTEHFPFSETKGLDKYFTQFALMNKK